jgi:hypothetical protein
MTAVTDNSTAPGAAIEAHYQFLVWLVPIDKFFKSRKLLLATALKYRLDLLEAPVRRPD